MKILSVHQMKKNKTVDLTSPPAMGSTRRLIYDLLKSSPGEPIELPLDLRNKYTVIQALREVYGLDVRSYNNGRYWLVGEWLADGTYIDYIVDKVNKWPVMDIPKDVTSLGQQG